MKTCKIKFGGLILLAGLISITLLPIKIQAQSNQIQVPKTLVEPVIDGQMDNVWYNVTSNRMLQYCTDSPLTAPGNWYDLTGSYRLMWDDDNLYFYVHVIDEMIRNDGADSYLDDGIEFYIDGDNSKKSTYDRVDDIQIRLNYDWTSINQMVTGFGYPSINWGFNQAGFKFGKQDTDYGWDMEVLIPLESVRIPSEAEHIFGWEVQINDNDNGTRNHILKWWSASNDSWVDPSLFGTACLKDREVSETLDVAYTMAPPVIDGVRDAIWGDKPEITLHHFTYGSNKLSNWYDCAASFRAMWDDSYVYFFCSAVDEHLCNDSNDDLNDDSFEIYTDGNFSQGSSYDHIDDSQFFFPWNENSASGSPESAVDPDNFIMAQTNTYRGWNIEIAIPLADLNIPPVNGHLFGLEVAYNDDDNELSRNHQLHYWDIYDLCSQIPAYMASARLTGGPPSTISKGDVDMNSQIQAYDASLILKYLVGYVELNAEQQLYADVSSDQTISSLDASLILQYIVGVIQDFSNSVPNDPVPNGDFVMNNISVQNEEVITVPVFLENSRDILSFEGTITFDPECLELMAVEWPENRNAFSIETRTEGDQIQIAGCGTSPIIENGQFVTLRFKVKNNHFQKTSISIDNWRWNEAEVTQQAGSADISNRLSDLTHENTSAVPCEFSLHQNFPNPFNPETSVTYELPYTAFVEINVCNFLGQQVANLVRGKQQVGTHVVQFNAEGLPSGLYFIQMKSGSFQTIRKCLYAK